MSHPYQPKLDKEKERVVQEFTVLRNEQRNLVTNISKLEVDLKEHKYVELDFRWIKHISDLLYTYMDLT